MASVIPFLMWVVAVANEKTMTPRMIYIRRRAFAWSIVALIILNIIGTFTLYDEQPEASPRYVMRMGLWVIFLIIGFQKNKGENRGFMYSLWEDYHPSYVLMENEEGSNIAIETNENIDQQKIDEVSSRKKKYTKYGVLIKEEDLSEPDKKLGSSEYNPHEIKMEPEPKIKPTASIINRATTPVRDKQVSEDSNKEELPIQRLEELKTLFKKGLISEEEYKLLKAKVLGL